MTVHRLICILTLLALLPLSVGCSRTRVIDLADDPGTSKTFTRLASGEAVEVYGYTRPDDGFREWRGHLVAVPPDSLQFTQKRGYREPAPAPSFRLALTDVVSLDAREFSPIKTTFLVSGGLVILGVAIAGAVFAASGGIGL